MILSLLHHAVNHVVHHISFTLALAATSDHKSWAANLYCETLDQPQAKPRHQAVLMESRRALWDHQALATNSRLVVHIPEFSPVQSLRASPSSFLLLQ